MLSTRWLDETTASAICAKKTSGETAMSVWVSISSSWRAPGGIVTLFGENVATGTAQASRLPLTTELAGTEVILGGAETMYPDIQKKLKK